MKKTILLLFALVFSTVLFAQTTYYISTTGNIAATGTELDPFSIQYLEINQDHSGDTFLVKNGQYQGNFWFQTYGSANNPVIVKAQNWKQAKIIGGDNRVDGKRSIVKLTGAYMWLMDFELYDDNEKRLWVNWSDNILMATGAEIYAPGVKLINCVIHDIIEGIECWSPATGSLVKANAPEAHFNMIYNIGMDFSDDPRPQSGHGHAIYAQNIAGNALPKYFENNSFWGAFGEGIHFYTEGGNIQNMKANGNVIFNMIGYATDKIKSRATIIGSLSKDFNDLSYSNNLIFEEAVSIGYGTPWQERITINDNAIYVKKAFTMKRFLANGTEVKRNTFYTETGTLFNYGVGSNTDLNLISMQDNFFYNTSTQWSTSIGIQPPSGGTIYLQEGNWGANSTNNTISTNAPPLNIKITLNDYDSDFIKVAIVNYAATSTVNVTTMPFNNGDILEIYDTQNMSGTPTTITYNGSSYTFPMTNTTLEALHQNDTDVSHAAHTDSRFCEFLVRRVTGTSTPTPDPIVAKNDVGTDFTDGIAGEVVASIFGNNGNGIDLVNGVSANLSNIILTQVSATDAGIILDLIDGSVNINTSVAIGSHALTYKICQSSDPTNCDNGVVTFNITTDAPTGQSINSFTLYDGAGNIVSGFNTIQNNAVINLQTVPTALNIRANTSPSIVGSVYFQLDDANTLENIAPYDWFGNGSGTFSVGSHTLTATPYAEVLQGGTGGEPLSINFTVTDGGAIIPIVAVNDNFTLNTDGGDTGSVLQNDFFNNVSADENLLNITLTDQGGTGANLKAGNVLNVPSNLSIGTYNLTYQICETASAGNCSTANIGLVITGIVQGKTEKDTFQSTFSIYKDNGNGNYSVEFPIDTPVRNIFVHTPQGVTVMFKNYSNQADKKVYELTGVTAGSFYMVVYFEGGYVGRYITID